MGGYTGFVIHGNSQIPRVGHGDMILTRVLGFEGAGSLTEVLGQHLLKAQARQQEMEDVIVIAKIGTMDEELRNSPYRLLGVLRTAPDVDIRRAYKRRALQVHPDKTKSDDKDFKQVRAAFDVLSNPISRKQYDATHPVTTAPSQLGKLVVIFTPCKRFESRHYRISHCAVIPNYV